MQKMRTLRRLEIGSGILAGILAVAATAVPLDLLTPVGQQHAEFGVVAALALMIGVLTVLHTRTRSLAGLIALWVIAVVMLAGAAGWARWFFSWLFLPAALFALVCAIAATASQAATERFLRGDYRPANSPQS